MKRNQATTVSQTATGLERTSPLGTLGRGHWCNFGVFLLSVGTLLFEITLTRLFSVAQFYHFAFMIVSLAMLGFGASGTWLALAERGGFRVLSRRRRPDPDTTPPAPAPSPPAVEDSPSSASPPTSPGAALDIPLAPFALAFGIACLFAYGVFNWLPFDSFSIAWDMRQVLLLCLHYVVLAVPFFCSGAVLSLRFAQSPADGGQGSRVGTIYAYNLAGSAVGCVLALLLPGVMGGVGPVWISAALGGLAALVLLPVASRRRTGLVPVGSLLLVIVAATLVGLRPQALALNLSPYKGLSYALQVPGAETVWQAWNGYSRVDLVDSSAIRSLPGLSYRFGQAPPPQFGLFVDGDDMSPVLRAPLDTAPDGDEAGNGHPSLAFADYMPTAIAYQLRPTGRALILEPRGGLEVWVAASAGPTPRANEGTAGSAALAVPSIVAVTANPLIAQATRGYGLEAQAIPGIATVIDDPRSYVRRGTPADAGDDQYDVVTLALTRPYRPIRSGAYSLGEDYAYTVEAFRDYLARLAPEGLFVASSWLQTPPSESLRTFALIVEALEARDGDPRAQIVAFRGYAVMTFLVKESPFNAAELTTIQEFAASRAFDIVYAPGLPVESVNRYNHLPSPVYYEAFIALLSAGGSGSDYPSRDAWYAAYPFDVRPPTDDHPFFGHFFRWSQAGQVLAELGRTWQPFGGAGYFVLLALLVLSLVAAAALIGLPVVVARRAPATEFTQPPVSAGLLLTYFGLLGLGYLFVEIPLMQQTIRFLGYPARAVTVVLFTLLAFSGVGSALSSRLRMQPVWALAALVALIAGTAIGLPVLYSGLLSLPWGPRLVVTVAGLAPVGLLMGLPFPLGLRYAGTVAPQHVPWAWAANGAMSVVASVLSALVSLSVGFTWVLVAGAMAYALAALCTLPWRRDLY